MKGGTGEHVIAGVQKAFGKIQRPSMFIRGTCCCEECREQESELQALDRVHLPLARLNNPGCDPICFASDAAFGYLLPGLVKLVLNRADEYVDQFLFHAEQPERLTALAPAQARALIEVLDFLVLQEAAAFENNLAVDDLFRIRAKLETQAGRDP